MLNHWRLGEGKTVVLQHGFVGGSDYWAPQMASLGGMFDLIAPDMPGFAGSSGEPAADSIEGLAEALIGLLDGLGVDRFSLIGHSMGGMVAQQAALDHPQRIERLILYGTSATGNLPQRFETFERSIERLQSEGIDRSAERIAETWFVNGRKHPFYDLCRNAGKGASLDAAVLALRAIAKWDVTKRLGELTMPVLVICGDRDRSTHPDQSYALWHALPDARLCVMPACAHNVHLEKSDMFDRVVTDFLAASA